MDELQQLANEILTLAGEFVVNPTSEKRKALTGKVEQFVVGAETENLEFSAESGVRIMSEDAELQIRGIKKLLEMWKDMNEDSEE